MGQIAFISSKLEYIKRILAVKADGWNSILAKGAVSFLDLKLFGLITCKLRIKKFRIGFKKIYWLI